MTEHVPAAAGLPAGSSPKICINFPMRAVKHYSAWIGDADFAGIGRLVEELGFDALSVSEHPYPHRDWLSKGGHHAFDPFVMLAMWAATTKRVKLMTAIMVAGYRNPFLAAKAVSSLDVLSGGRVVLGMGAGYLREEFSALGADFQNRGRIFDESIGAMRAAWEGADFDGEYFSAHDHEARPFPAQPGGPPIWFGGNSAAARRRVASLGDGWMPIAQDERMAAVTGTPALMNVEALASQIAGVAARRAELGRGPFDVAFTPFEKDLLRTSGVEGMCEQLVPRLADYAEAGVTWLTIEPTSRSHAEFERDLRLLAEHLPSRAPAPRDI